MYSEMYDATFEEVAKVAFSNADFCLAVPGVFHSIPGGKCGTEITEVFLNSRVLVTEVTRKVYEQYVTISTVTFLSPACSVSFREGNARKACTSDLLQGVKSTIYLTEIDNLLSGYAKPGLEESSLAVVSSLKNEFRSMDREKCPPSEFISFWVRCMDKIVECGLDTGPEMDDSVCGPDVMEITGSEVLIRVRRLRLLDV